jgi:pimeloyl-ACP methyl ester carboxylesterase
VLSSTPFTDEAFRRARAQRPPIDAVELRDDGAHLTALWGKRQPWYPRGRADLLHAFVLDALKVRDVESGHRAVAAYRMEDRVASIHQPTLLIRAPDDPFASTHAAQWQTHLGQAEVVDIEGGMVPLPDQLPQAFASAVLRFLDRVVGGTISGTTRPEGG